MPVAIKLPTNVLIIMVFNAEKLNIYFFIMVLKGPVTQAQMDGLRIYREQIPTFAQVLNGSKLCFVYRLTSYCAD